MSIFKDLLMAIFEKKESKIIQKHVEDIANDTKKVKELSKEIDETMKSKIPGSERKFKGGISLDELMDEVTRENKRIK